MSDNVTVFTSCRQESIKLCSTYITGLISGNLLSCKNKTYFSLIPIDLSTFFDIVAHQVLLKKKIVLRHSKQNFQMTFKLSFKQKKNFQGWENQAHARVMCLLSPKAASRRTR